MLGIFALLIIRFSVAEIRNARKKHILIMGLYAEENGEITMGNIRQNYIKALTSQLLEEHGDEFSTDFGPNKELVTKYTNVDSKVIRNRVAGYIVRQLRVKAIRKK